MDFREKAGFVIKKLNTAKSDIREDGSFIHDVCDLFDIALISEINESDLEFLKYISSECGIPQYYSLFIRIKNKNLSNYNLSSLLSDIKNLPLHTSIDYVLHFNQKKVFDSFSKDIRNRYFLSAPTSFGKTFILYEIIKKMDYHNILLIFPTIALLSENQMKIIDLQKENEFWKRYKIHTLSEDADAQDYNIWLFTPERYLSFLDNNNSLIVDFCFMDEIYKIDNSFIIDTETIGENERDVAFRVALHYVCQNSKDILLAGPYINISNNCNNSSFDSFIKSNSFRVLNFNDIEVVNKEIFTVQKGITILSNNFNYKADTINETKNLIRLLKQIPNNEATIVYCSRKYACECCARKILKENVFDNPNDAEYQIFVNHIGAKFSKDWIVYKALVKGIGIHHGVVPKYIQKEIIRFFNKGIIKVIFSTTTITEGVNTSAKNIFVLDYKKGNKTLKAFDAKNIAGRAGRFDHHFSGRVISFKSEFNSILGEKTENLKHVNYEREFEKSDADIDITDDPYLTPNDKHRRKIINEEARRIGLPDQILNNYKSISKKVKIDLYKSITEMSQDEICEVQKVGRFVLSKKTLYLPGFQIAIEKIKNFVSEKNLLNIIENKSKDYSLVTWLVNAYFKGGFFTILNYKINNQHAKYDAAIRETCALNFNVFKYQLVKYLGIFDLLLRFYLGGIEHYQNITVLGSSIKKLEYGYLENKARIANDFGAPFNVLQFLETNDKTIKDKFDKYEMESYIKLDEYLN